MGTDKNNQGKKWEEKTFPSVFLVSRPVDAYGCYQKPLTTLTMGTLEVSIL